jgi:cystathionine gamma-synthase
MKLAHFLLLYAATNNLCRSLEVRVERQSQTATALAAWLSSGAEKDPCLSIISRIHHASLSHPTLSHENPPKLLEKQKAKPSGVFSIEFNSLHHARLVCSHLKLIANATSLGGVESLIEWRAAVDSKIDPRICRVSIGLENVEDLKNDFRQAFATAKKLVEDMK